MCYKNKLSIVKYANEVILLALDSSEREGCMKHISGLMTNAKFPISI